MNSIKSAAKEFLRRDGQHTTEAHEEFRPAVTKEFVKPVEVEKETVAIDREIHQDHYQTRIQPIRDQVRVEDHHEHKILPAEHRKIREGDRSEAERKVAAELGQFKSTTTTLPTERHATAAGTVTGEHVHHHVHEIIQPVIEREVIQPTIVHSTKPIHETIEKAPQVHPPTVQPTMTLAEFEKMGGHLHGVPEKVVQRYDGCPEVRENGGADRKKPDPLANTAKGATGLGTVGAGSSVGGKTAAGLVGGAAAVAAGREHRKHRSGKPRLQRRGSSSSYSSSSSSASSSDEEGSSIKKRSSLTGGYKTSSSPTTSVGGSNKPRSMVDDAMNPSGTSNTTHHGPVSTGGMGKDPRATQRDGTASHGQDALSIVKEKVFGAKH